MGDYSLISKEFDRLFNEVRYCTERCCALRSVRTLINFYEQHENNLIPSKGAFLRVIMLEVLQHCFRLQIPKYDLVCRIFRTTDILDWKYFFSHLIMSRTTIHEGAFNRRWFGSAENGLFMLRTSIGNNSLNRTGEDFVCRNPKDYMKFSVLSYLLFAGTMGQFTFCSHERLVDMKETSVTCLTSLMQGRKEDVLIFLQFGGRFSYLEFIPGNKDLRQIIIALDCLITVGASKQQWDRTTLQPLNSNAQIPVAPVKDLVEKFCILMRTVENPHVATYEIANKRAQYCTPINGSPGELLEAEAVLPDTEKLNKFYERIFPGLGFGQKRPPSLQHTCRCHIRRQLFNNWQLPLGIYKLRLPSHIQDYLNLVYD